ncbi:MAG: electron transfer flavoprotein subunit alpha/FixB family protein [Chitinophagaceae bacterium]|nr:electron transfer flavoprotein subunit alpha/FixB family protein [Chitinophagaceae bacterium]
MSVLIYIDTADGHVKKSSLEAISYGAAVAAQLGTTAEGFVAGPVSEDLAALGQYGVTAIHHADDAALAHFDAKMFAKLVADAAGSTGATVVVLSNNVNGKALSPRLSARLKAGLIAGAVALPDTSNGFVVRKNVFSGKAYADIKVNSDIKIIALNPNAYAVKTGGAAAAVTKMAVSPGAPSVKVTNTSKASGDVVLTEAEIVVSAGRGMKGPENWGIVEDLAKALHAATACSRPVADAHWRPHNEHVGQTGFAIAPNLYIAIGISGAIQHLAGVNRSKVIVVINKDPEAPFFKAADYGIVGDAFEVVPQMTAAIKKLKGTA